jgi:uncharacterized protein
VDGVLFEWDPTKNKSNIRKHKIGFAEARSVFGDPLSITIPDPDHAIDEERFIIIGMTDTRKVLTVVHTIRGERIRLISARPATNREKRTYEEGGL